jgi:hypothetical protein
VALFASATAIVSLLAVLTMRETYRTHLYDLGKRRRGEAVPARA